MFCSECGNKIELDYSIKFCKNCGTKIEWLEKKDNVSSDDFSEKKTESDSSQRDFSTLENFIETVADTEKIEKKVFSSINEGFNKRKTKAEHNTFSNFNNLDPELIFFNDKHFIPSYHIATSSIEDESIKLTPFKDKEFAGNPFSWVAVKVNKQNSIGTRKIKISIIENEFIKNSEEEFEIIKKGDNYLLPQIAWDFKALKENKQLSPFVFQAKVTTYDYVGKSKEVMLQETCQMVSVNFCPFYAKTVNEELFFWDMFAAYVNEDHPEVQRILDEVLKRKDPDTGENIGEIFISDRIIPKNIIVAIWEVLKESGIQYSNITDSSYAQKGDVRGQNMRLFGDVEDSTQANCADGSVFMASILRKIGYDVSLVLGPGHMWIMVDGKGIEFNELHIETTTLGGDPEKNFEPMTLDEAEKRSWEFIESRGIDGFINLRQVRAKGLLPIGAKEKYLN